MINPRWRHVLSDDELREIARQYRSDPTVMHVLWDLRRLKATASRSAALLVSLDANSGVPPQVLEARKAALRVILEFEPWAGDLRGEGKPTKGR